MSSSTYRKNVTREDPRLARRESSSLYDDLEGKSKGNNRDPRIRDEGWHRNENYGQQQMQTAYQHLPPSIYSDPNQYAAQSYQSGYTAYQQNYQAAYNHYQGYNQTGYGPPIVPGSEYPQTGWAPVAGYVAQQQQQQQQPTQSQMTSSEAAASSEGKKDGVAQEIKQQKAQLVKQREEYVKKIKVLRRELEVLRKQEKEFLSEKSPERDTEHILAENNKLQNEIRTKLKALCDVVEMLSSLIRDNQSLEELEKQFEVESPTRSREKTRKSGSTDRFDESKKYNYVHYDPELHWCRTCDVFPKTAKDLLLHLQSEQHRQVAQERGMKDDTPWHHLPTEPELPYYEGAPKKRLPIKGLQFFIPAPAWYCKLCDTWIGDLHCASQHLKSQTHSQNYSNFVEQNPHWELEWLKDREKALARVKQNASSDSEDTDRKRKKRKDKHTETPSKDKKKKKRSKKRRKHSTESSSSSSSSSDSSSEDEEPGDKSKSIRVAMRNMKVQQIMNEDLGSKWEMLGRLVEERKQKEKEKEKEKAETQENPQEDKLINQWMTVSEPQDKDKVMLNSLKDRMKQKQEAEKVRWAEMEKQRKEQEKKEMEEAQRKEREEKEAKEREEQLRKERERQELERIRDKERERVRLSTRKREDSVDSKEHSRSPSYERKRSRRSSERSRENGRSSKERRSDSESPRRHDKKPPPPPSYKKLPFIGRMPLFKNKKPEEKVEKEIKKEDYDIPRQTRFEPGNLPRAFIPEPEVVCFPKLSSIPPLSMPVQPPEPPKIKPPKAPPPPKIGENVKPDTKDEKKVEEERNKKEEDETYNNFQKMIESNPMAQYQYDYTMLYQPPVFDYQDDVPGEAPPEITGEVPPLQPPPLPPDDPSADLAMLGISADDMAAQIL